MFYYFYIKNDNTTIIYLFLIQNNQCEFKTRSHKFKYVCTEKFVINVDISNKQIQMIIKFGTAKSIITYYMDKKYPPPNTNSFEPYICIS